MGPADEGLQDAAQQENLEVHRQTENEVNGSLTEKGSFYRRPPAEKGGDHESRAREEGHQDLVPTFHDHPRYGRPHDRRAQRPEVRAGLHLREHGRAQAWRVRPDAHLQGPQRQEGGESGHAGQSGGSSGSGSARNTGSCDNARAEGVTENEMEATATLRYL